MSVVWAPEQKVEWILDYSLSIKASFCETPNQVPSIDARAVQQHADTKPPCQILSLSGSLRFFAESDNLLTVQEQSLPHMAEFLSTGHAASPALLAIIQAVPKM